MKITRFFLLLALGTAPLVRAHANAPDYLHACWQQQVKPLRNSGVSFRYQETLAQLEHSFQPWQATEYTGTGRVWSSPDRFGKSDTLRRGSNTYFSQTQYAPAMLLFRDYGEKELTPVTEAGLLEYPVQAARYTPAPLINYMVARPHALAPESTPQTAVYRARLGGTEVRLYVDTHDARLRKITALSSDDLFGDVLTTYTYEDYATLGRLAYARRVVVAKINGKLTDTVTLLAATRAAVPTLLTAPAGHRLAPAGPAGPHPVTTEHYSPHLHLLGLAHTDDKVLVVEFDTFLLVAEAPLTSANGELIIQEAGKIAPGKPIRYFVAGHYHPHYLGGVRPFVRRGATVLTTAGTLPYVQYLAAAPRTLQPDSLQRHPRPLQAEIITASKTIAEGGFEMQIYLIGSKSQHTNDYLIYYFPTQKVLFEDDLAWVPRQGEIKKASARQAGLYQAVRELGLDVKTVLQSWPVKDYGVKTTIPFSDLEQAMRAK